MRRRLNSNNTLVARTARTSAYGAIAASFLIGLTEALAGSYVSYAYKDAIAFLIMIAVLLWRPQGLFGRRIGI